MPSRKISTCSAVEPRIEIVEEVAEPAEVPHLHADGALEDLAEVGTGARELLVGEDRGEGRAVANAGVGRRARLPDHHGLGLGELVVRGEVDLLAPERGRGPAPASASQPTSAGEVARGGSSLGELARETSARRPRRTGWGARGGATWRPASAGRGPHEAHASSGCLLRHGGISYPTSAALPRLSAIGRWDMITHKEPLERPHLSMGLLHHLREGALGRRTLVERTGWTEERGAHRAREARGPRLGRVRQAGNVAHASGQRASGRLLRAGPAGGKARARRGRARPECLRGAGARPLRSAKDLASA
jgi:hypothetical protein